MLAIRSTITGTLLVLALAGLAFGVMRATEAREQDALRRQADAHQRAQSRLSTDHAAALDALEEVLRSATIVALDPAVRPPLCSGRLSFRLPEAGVVTIRTEEQDGAQACVIDATEGRREVIALGVASHFAGEAPNGIDDNRNGLIDEQGLYFSVSDAAVEVGLTLSRKSPLGQVTASGTRKVAPASGSASR